MKALIFQNEHKQTILRLTPESPEEGFTLGMQWKSREADGIVVKRSSPNGELEFVLQNRDKEEKK